MGNELILFHVMMKILISNFYTLYATCVACTINYKLLGQFARTERNGHIGGIVLLAAVMAIVWENTNGHQHQPHLSLIIIWYIMLCQLSVTVVIFCATSENLMSILKKYINHSLHVKTLSVLCHKYQGKKDRTDCFIYSAAALNRY